MKNDVKYLCLLGEDSDSCYSEDFETPEEAENEGIKAAKKYNNRTDEDTFDIFGEYAEEDREEITEFYIFKTRYPEILNNLGEYVLDYISEVGEIAELDNLTDSDWFINRFTNDQIEELNKLIYNWIDKNTDDYSRVYLDLYKKVEVKE